MQRISVTASLNGTKFQFDEAAYARLESYLAEAARTLAGNPDRDEIMADLEQAIVDQCRHRTRSLHPIITLAELEPALDEIGAVQDAADESAPERPAPGRSRHLEQVSEGALISGVCKGLARYSGADVTLLRVIAVLLLIVTGGVMIVIYGALMLMLPYAAPDPGAGPIRRIPAKSREFVEFIRAKLSAVTN